MIALTKTGRGKPSQPRTSRSPLVCTLSSRLLMEDHELVDPFLPTISGVLTTYRAEKTPAQREKQERLAFLQQN